MPVKLNRNGSIWFDFYLSARYLPPSQNYQDKIRVVKSNTWLVTIRLTKIIKLNSVWVRADFTPRSSKITISKTFFVQKKKQISFTCLIKKIHTKTRFWSEAKIFKISNRAREIGSDLDLEFKFLEKNVTDRMSHEFGCSFISRYGP